MNISKLEQLINYDFKTKSLIEEASNLSDRLVSLGTSTIEHIILKTINEELYLNSNSYFDNDSINNLINYLKSDEYLIVSIYIKDFVNLTGGVDIIGPLSKGYLLMVIK